MSTVDTSPKLNVLNSLLYVEEDRFCPRNQSKCRRRQSKCGILHVEGQHVDGQCGQGYNQTESDFHAIGYLCNLSRSKCHHILRILTPFDNPPRGGIALWYGTERDGGSSNFWLRQLAVIWCACVSSTVLRRVPAARLSEEFKIWSLLASGLVK
jgi:hypothetical protein